MQSRAKYRPICLDVITCIAIALSTSSARAIAPDDPGAAAIRFTLNSSQDVKSISPWIYGMNFFAGSSLTNPVTLDRLGGNRWSAYNWETNDSNAGKDYKYENDNFLTSSSIPGAAVRPSLQDAAANNRGLVVTVPVAGYVSADDDGPVALADFAPSARFKQVAAKKSAVYPGSSLSLTPNTADDYVFTDEFANWVEQTKDPSQTVFYSLDNEPALWGESLPPGFNVDNWDNHLGNQPGRTHPEIHPYAPTFAEMKQKTIDNAGAIKDVNPNAIVFGGVPYGYAEFTNLQGASDATSSPSHPGGDQAGELNYLEWLLRETKNAETTQGRKLMDVLDVHWYPEAQGGGVRITENNNSAAVVAARVQAPRSLWDPTYTETSWITGCCSGGPIKLLPNLQRDVDDFNPGTKLAITEYNYGGTNHISGGIAQADALGIFGREGLFAATFWSLYGDSQSQFTSGAFKMYLDYDGAGGEFGDTAIDSETTSINDSAVYASVDSSDPNRMVVVAINRSGSDQTTGIAVAHDRVFDHAEVYQLTSASANPVRAADIELDLLNAFQYTMPAFSVTTLVLISDGLPGDFNRDGTVDAADYTVWRNSLGQTGNTAADANEDNLVDAQDYAMWKANFGLSELGGAGSLTTVPEPSALALMLLAACGPTCRRRRFDN
jgi:Glycoside hydrolase family 44/Dockerin type I domain/PEP-CTERM motif